MTSLRIEQGSEDELVRILRGIGVRGAPTLKPYEKAEISIQVFRAQDLTPLSNYVLREQLDFLDRLREDLLQRGVDILNLSGLLSWEKPDTKEVIAPPIVEDWGDEGKLLVDGLHRAWIARRENTPLRTACVRGVEAPLVPLPTDWDGIRVFDIGERPTLTEKRSYRFTDPEALRDAVPAVADAVTEDNYRYFLFRMLDALGSSGIRTPTRDK